MKVALGASAHSGWAALVAVGDIDGVPAIVCRERIELVDDAWAKQPYHAAEHLPPDAARDLVERGLEAGRRVALRELRACVQRVRERGHEVSACAVLVGKPMPDWSVAEILAVHFRMHKAEGVVFRDALLRAAQACGLRALAIPEKEVVSQASEVLGLPAARLAETVGALGRAVGPPWGKDQKDAALAALVALRIRVS